MVVATGAGETSPTDSNDTAEGRHNNRRVVIKATR
jgi:flagellar motor protein MotB